MLHEHSLGHQQDPSRGADTKLSVLPSCGSLATPAATLLPWPISGLPPDLLEIEAEGT